MPGDADRYSVAAHDPVDDGSATTTAAIQAAIDTAADAGGGVVHVPPGEYVIGTVELRDNVTLHIGAGATLIGSTSLEDYAHDELSRDFFPDPKTRDEWNEAPAPLIVAEGAHDIGLTGSGRIDGRGSDFWTLEPGHSWSLQKNRPGMMIRFSRCTGIRIRDVQMHHSPAWTLHLRGCEDVAIHNARVDNHVFGPNTDGIDIDACRNVRISDCEIVSGGDDGIVLKNVLKGLREYPEEASRNITVTNCDIASRTNPFKIGTENYAGFEDVTLSNSVLRGCRPGLDYELDSRLGECGRPASGIALEMVDGATLDGVTISNVTMRDVQAPIFLRVGNRPRYRTEQDHLDPGSVKNVSICNAVVSGATRPAVILGLPDGTIENVSIANVQFEIAGGETDPGVPARDLPEKPAVYPEANRWGTFPASGFYCRHVEGLALENVSVTMMDADVRPVVIADDVVDLRLDGFTGEAPNGEQPLVRLTDVRRALLTGVIAPAGLATALQVEGNASSRISLTGSDLTGVTRASRVAESVSAEAVSVFGNNP